MSISDAAHQLMESAREQGADGLPLVPHRPQGNRLERFNETWGDHVGALMHHCRLIPHLRPFASTFMSDIPNLFQAVSRTYEGGACSAPPYWHRLKLDPAWLEKDSPPFGSLVTVVPAKSKCGNESGIESRGSAMLFFLT